MAQLFKGLICLSDIDKDRIVTFKNGKKYINIIAWHNDQPDQYGNIMSVQQQTKKDEDKIYIGNLKENDSSQKTPDMDINKDQKPPEDDLPF